MLRAYCLTVFTLSPFINTHAQFSVSVLGNKDNHKAQSRQSILSQLAASEHNKCQYYFLRVCFVGYLYQLCDPTNGHTMN